MTSDPIITLVAEAYFVYRWRCPTCGKEGQSKSRHGANVRLRAHWRDCPPPAPAAAKEQP